MEKSNETFFSKLRSLALTVERQCETYGKSVSKKETEFCAPHANKKIVDLRKDIKQMKAPSQSELDQARQDVQLLENTLSAGTAFLSNQLQMLREYEEYLAHYGYKPYEGIQCSKPVQQDVEEDSKEETEADTQNIPTTPPLTKPATDPNRTPRLEEAGISQKTLQFLNSLQKNKCQPEKASVSRTKFPSVFEHSGIICTPSLTRDNNYNPDLHAALASPDVFSSKKPPFQDEKEPGPLERLEFEITVGDSPAPPVFCTPGMKQLLAGSKPTEEVTTNLRPPNKRPVNVGLFQSDMKSGASSTVKQASVNGHCEITSADSQSLPIVPELSNSFGDEEPPEPELTYSLEALTEMTGIFMINPLKKLQPSTKSHLTFTEHLVSDNKENATPPEPEMLTDRISRIRVNQDSTKQDFVPPHRGYGDMPPSPKLLGNYHFLKK